MKADRAPQTAYVRFAEDARFLIVVRGEKLFVILFPMRKSKSTYNATYRATPEGKATQRAARARWKKVHRVRNLCNDYRITKAEREVMYAEQNGLCGLCNKPMTFDETHLDHVHETGKRRSLTHPTCNWLIGWMERYSSLVPLVMPYIEHHKGN